MSLGAGERLEAGGIAKADVSSRLICVSAFELSDSDGRPSSRTRDFRWTLPFNADGLILGLKLARSWPACFCSDPNLMDFMPQESD